MSKILLVGDTHGSYNELYLIYKTAQKNEVEAIVQLGDFGFGWDIHNKTNQCNWSRVISTQYYQKYKIPLYWIDGNHENFDRLEKIPLDENGYREIFPGVIHLSRGSKIKFGETTFLALGGAYSVDKNGRKIGKSWWEQETITDEDVDRAIKAGPADILLTHDIPFGVEEEESLIDHISHYGQHAIIGSQANERRVSQVLESCGARKVFHGHLHRRYAKVMDSGVMVVGLNCQDTGGENLLVIDC